MKQWLAVLIGCIVLFCGCHVEDIPYLIEDDDSALAFADVLMGSVDDTFCVDYEHPDNSVLCNGFKHYYRVRRSNSSKPYVMELWVDEEDKITVKNAYLDGQPVTSPWITDAEAAKRLGDVVLQDQYKVKIGGNIENAYPDLTVSEEANGEWCVMRNDGGVNGLGSAMTIKVCADGTVYGLEWGGE